MGFNDFLMKLFGNKSEKDMKELMPIVGKVNAEWEQLKNLDIDALRQVSADMKAEIRQYIKAETDQIAEYKRHIDEENPTIEEREEIYNEIDKIEKIAQGDLIDLRAAETIRMKAGDFKLIPLGVAMELPKGYKANVYPRSSTFKNFGIILANSVGQIDESYCGDNDQWMFPAIALRDTIINVNDRICQFEIQKKQPDIEFVEVDFLGNEDRGGIGSTGTK